MIKRNVFFLFVLLISFHGMAQKPSFGVKGGINFSTVSGTANQTDPVTGRKNGSHWGLFADFRLTKNFALQPEIIYSVQGFDQTDRVVGTKNHLNYLNIPLMAKLYIGKNFYLQSGPQLGFLLSAPIKVRYNYTNDEVKSDDRENYRSRDISYCFGLGVDFLKRFSISGRYNLGISNVSREIAFTSNPVSNRVMQFSFGIKLGKIKKESDGTDL